MAVKDGDIVNSCVLRHFRELPARCHSRTVFVARGEQSTRIHLDTSSAFAPTGRAGELEHHGRTRAAYATSLRATMPEAY